MSIAGYDHKTATALFIAHSLDILNSLDICDKN